CEDVSKMLRRFTLLPFPNFKWRYVTMNARALASNAKQTCYHESMKLFYNAFDFAKFDFNR
ncbi:hypothetical protein K501DRAFT_178954, partial [Backusella circina FSU 941]